MTHFFELSAMLSNPSAILPHSDHQKLLQEFERVKESENGWKDCAQLLISDQSINDQTKFFCMQIIEAYLKTRYAKAEQSEQAVLKQFMSTWLQMQMNRKANEKNFITRKAAQLFALVSLIDFPNRWPTFFNDLMATCSWSTGNADFYLKVLLAIDCEIVDRELPRTPEETNIITFYKDSIRSHCVNDLVESWFMLLKEHSSKNAEITCQTLEVIGAYISWIEINLIVNNRFVEFFAYALGQVDLREITCGCLEEIVNKGMDIGAKLKLVDYLWLHVIQAHAAALEQQKGLSNDDEDNCDYLLKFGKLLNAIGENLFDGWTKMIKKDANLAGLLAQSIEAKLPFVLQILNHSDDDISECVSDYCSHYISILKVMKIQTREHQSNVENMFKIVINKTKFDSSFNFENEGEEEAMFLEYRKSIKLLFDSITQLDNDFALSTIKTYVLDAANNWQMKPFADIENALYLFYLLGEAIPCTQGNHFQARSHKTECLSEMMRSIIQSNLIQSPHRIVKFQYFENVVRYYKFFLNYPQLVEPVVEHFIGEHGLHNQDPKLRSRVSYLFSRFTKDLKNLVSNYVEKILNTIQDLLVIWSPLEANLSISNKNQQVAMEGPLSADDQLFLYETVSVLIVSCSLEANIKAQLMKSLLTPTVSCFAALINKYCAASDEKEKLIYAKCLNTAMSVASRASKGFSNQIKVKDCNCVEIFLEILRIFMSAISINTHKSLIHAGIRQYLHRMIVCLDNEVLEYLPLTVEHLVKMSSEPKDLYDVMPLINQILNKYKQQIVPFMQLLLMELVNMVLNFVNVMPALVAATGTHLLKVTPLQLTTASAATADASNGELSLDAQLVLDAQLLYKSYFQFLLNIVNNELMDIVAGQSGDHVYKIFYTLIEGAQNGTLETIKCCFQTMRKFIVVFVDKPNILNFVQYTMENVVPCCFQNFIKPNVDLNDAQQVLVFNEIGQYLILLHSKFGEDFLKYLEFTYLPTLQLNQQIIQAIIQTIKSNNPKGLKALRESIQQMAK